MVEATQLPQVEAQVEVVRGLVAGLDPDWVPVPEAPAMWRAFDAIARAAGAAQVLLARRVEDSPIWQKQGCRSAAEYLARVSGRSVRGAREVLRASKHISDVPIVQQALRDGRLSVTQAEMITDATSQDPDKQTELVDAAGRLSLAQLAEQCGRVKAAADPDPEATYKRIHANRRLRQRTDSQGAWCLHGRGTPDDGALFRYALEPLIDQIFDQARQEDRHDHRDAYTYDALIELLNRYLDTQEEATDSDEDTDDEDKDEANPQRGNEDGNHIDVQDDDGSAGRGDQADTRDDDTKADDVDGRGGEDDADTQGDGAKSDQVDGRRDGEADARDHDAAGDQADARGDGAVGGRADGGGSEDEAEGRGDGAEADEVDGRGGENDVGVRGDGGEGDDHRDDEVNGGGRRDGNDRGCTGPGDVASDGRGA